MTSIQKSSGTILSILMGAGLMACGNEALDDTFETYAYVDNLYTLDLLAHEFWPTEQCLDLDTVFVEGCSIQVTQLPRGAVFNGHILQWLPSQDQRGHHLFRAEFSTQCFSVFPNAFDVYSIEVSEQTVPVTPTSSGGTSVHDFEKASSDPCN